MSNFKKDLACNISLITVLVFTVVHILVLTLNLFGATDFAVPDYFNYIVAYVLVILSLGLYIFGFFITKIRGLILPVWFRIMFYFAFFVFTNTYYLSGLFANIYAVIFLFAYISLLVNILSLSIFYNVNKDEKNRLKTPTSYIIASVFFYSVAINAIIQFVINIFKAFLFKEFVFSTIMATVVEFSAMLLVSIIVAVVFNKSLKGTKGVINACLIKYYKEPAIKRSVKQ